MVIEQQLIRIQLPIGREVQVTVLLDIKLQTLLSRPRAEIQYGIVTDSMEAEIAVNVSPVAERHQVVVQQQEEHLPISQLLIYVPPVQRVGVTQQLMTDSLTGLADQRLVPLTINQTHQLG